MDVRPHVAALRRYIEGQDFRGYDPYDALNSPLLRAVSLGRKWGRIAAIQALKRCPVNLRPLLGVPRGLNPKGLGLFLWGYAKLYAAEGETAVLARIHDLLDGLAALRSPGASGNAWGYNFPWQSRAFYVPAGTPTIVNSSFIGHALLDAWRHAGLQRALDLAVPIAAFILRDLHRTVAGDAFCFSYTPLDRTAVHNANLLGASLLARLHRVTGEERLREAALASLAYSMKCQRDDGAWHYAETDYQRWIDSFHTGFNLQCIRYFLREGLAPEAAAGYERGVRFYAENFFLPDGTPKYYHDRVYPVDIHSAAQAIAFFADEGPPHRDLADRVLRWSLENMWDARGFFYFQRREPWTIRIPYIRWSQAWMWHALTAHWLAARTEDGERSSV
jgi:hypothetical protein